jgi:hypothetical protein
MDKEMIVGRTEDELVQLEYDPSSTYFAISGTTYRLPSFTEEEGEEMAQDQLDNGDYDYLWREAVKAERTEQGLDDWKQDIIDYDGWESIVGDVTQIGNGDYVQMDSCGQIDLDTSDLVKTYISVEDLEFIKDSWEKYHLKDMSEVPEEVKDRMLKIFSDGVEVGDWVPDLEEDD